MNLQVFDWVIIGFYFLFTLFIGLWTARKAGQSADQFFLSGRQMPWWLLGVSMVATTFSADTPNLVTDIVRNHGVAGNWMWWAFLLTGMLTVFVYAHLWRKAGLFTDLEFYELRYGGWGGAFLRGFRAVYLGLFFNVLIMASVTLAAIKISGILLGISPLTTVILAGIVTLIYSSSGGLRSVLLTDFFQFIMAMAGSIWAAVYLTNIEPVNGINNLLAHPDVRNLTSIFPDTANREALISLLIIPLAVQWWSVWYPGAEPGGGGYIAQRMLAARNEKHATGATLLFNIAHYALRPWPWIIIALASVIVFPTLDSIKHAFPHVDPSILKDDLAYPAMLSLLPTGLLGLVAASLIAAYMSTISTHLNWGASYLVNDVYKRFIHPAADERTLVLYGRVTTAALMVISGIFALMLENALQAFNILLQIGAGTGLIFILRWFWWRINAWTEISGMVISFFVAIYFQFIHTTLGFPPLNSHIQLISGVAITTMGWLLITLLTPPESSEVLTSFYKKIQPAMAGWKPVIRQHIELQKYAVTGRLPLQLAAMFTGCAGVYAFLFTTGSIIYGLVPWAIAGVVICLASGGILFNIWKKLFD